MHAFLLSFSFLFLQTLSYPSTSLDTKPNMLQWPSLYHSSSFSTLLPDQSSTVINSPSYYSTIKALINPYFLKHHLNFTNWHSSSLKYSLSLPLAIAVSPPPAKILGILPIGWGEHCFSVPREILWLPRLAILPLLYACQNSGHSFRPSSGWSPSMKYSLTIAASSRPFYFKVFTALIAVNTIPPSTLI